ncbi:MAG: DUF192 domain-containing protein [Inquilinus sp.]|nr:DUF192 domain-containing protein [Inquilinus sp.]
MPRFLALLAAPFVLALVLIAPPASAQESSDLWIETEAGGRYKFRVELALTPAQQARGLMNRASMASDAGMLFVFDSERPASFWMKNTLISLDMLFIGADGRIVNIGERTTPLSTDSVPAAAPVKAVLEINGGLSAILGIRAGDRVRHPALTE